ncbi:hypothetical protein [Simiduia aestuariiviva]|uniref:Uncharacterized protein n=1 Tax=Simiduia aestuariiviva TaxID=1510459 RepID=A0A839URF2_9GAMM|nr:hypothetical protein [Simiduia aestuariiviva]MBB3168118.1 hypothetical protein [Simiduia aestuariiviva]
MTLECKGSDELKRAAGDLGYSTHVNVVPAESRLRLDETLLAHNGQTGSSGLGAERAVAHLVKPAFVQVADGELLYFHSEGSENPYRFKKI